MNKLTDIAICAVIAVISAAFGYFVVAPCVDKLHKAYVAKKATPKQETPVVAV